jgi:hypothetical protein
MIGFIAPYTFTQFGTTGNYSAFAILRTFQFTVAHALLFLVLTSRILATDLSQSHFNFKSHMKSIFHSLILFLLFLLIHFWLPSPELDPNLFRLLFCTTYIALRRTHRKQRFLYCCEGMFTAPLPSNRRPIVPRVCFCGNVFSESLPSNGYTRHIIFLDKLKCCASIYVLVSQVISSLQVFLIQLRICHSHTSPDILMELNHPEETWTRGCTWSFLLTLWPRLGYSG